MRHGKSTFCDEFLTAWYLMLHPDRQVILATYGNDFSCEWSRKAKDHFKEHALRLFGLEVGLDRADHWTIKGHRGGMRAVGAGGPISGKGADLLICDDLVKDQQAAESPTERHSLWRWFQGDALSRLEPGGRAICILSRRHPEDVVGGILDAQEAGGTSWRRIRLPALAEADDPLGRKPGEALWPERYPVKELERIKLDLEIAGTPHLWDSLYQQDPRGDPSLTEFDPRWFDGILYDELPPGLPVQLRILGCDPSKGTTSKAGDPAAILFALIDNGGTMWVEDAVLKNMPAEDVKTTAAAMINRYGVQAWTQDCNGFQSVLANDTKAMVPAHVFFAPYANQLKKETRIKLGLQGYLAQRRIRLKRTAANLAGLGQLKSFPTGAHDDFPDCLEMMWAMLAQLARPAAPPQKVIRA